MSLDDLLDDIHDVFTALEPWVPSAVEWFAELVFGKYPLGDADTLYALADAVGEASQELSAGGTASGRLVEQILRDWGGDGGAMAFGMSWTDHQTSLTDQVNALSDMQSKVQQLGVQINTVKFEIVANLIALAIAIIVSIVASILSGGLSLANAAAAFGRTKGAIATASTAAKTAISRIGFGGLAKAAGRTAPRITVPRIGGLGGPRSLGPRGLGPRGPGGFGGNKLTRLGAFAGTRPAQLGFPRRFAGWFGGRAAAGLTAIRPGLGRRLALGAGFMASVNTTAQGAQIASGRREGLDIRELATKTAAGAVFVAPMAGRIGGHVLGGGLGGGLASWVHNGYTWLTDPRARGDINWLGDFGHGALQGAAAGGLFGGLGELNRLGRGETVGEVAVPENAPAKAPLKWDVFGKASDWSMHTDQPVGPPLKLVPWDSPAGAPKLNGDGGVAPPLHEIIGRPGESGALGPSRGPEGGLPPGGGTPSGSSPHGAGGPRPALAGDGGGGSGGGGPRQTAAGIHTPANHTPGNHTPGNHTPGNHAAGGPGYGGERAVAGEPTSRPTEPGSTATLERPRESSPDVQTLTVRELGADPRTVEASVANPSAKSDGGAPGVISEPGPPRDPGTPARPHDPPGRPDLPGEPGPVREPGLPREPASRTDSPSPNTTWGQAAELAGQVARVQPVDSGAATVWFHDGSTADIVVEPGSVDGGLRVEIPEVRVGPDGRGEPVGPVRIVLDPAAPQPGPQAIRDALDDIGLWLGSPEAPALPSGPGPQPAPAPTPRGGGQPADLPPVWGQPTTVDIGGAPSLSPPVDPQPRTGDPIGPARGGVTAALGATLQSWARPHPSEPPGPGGGWLARIEPDVPGVVVARFRDGTSARVRIDVGPLRGNVAVATAFPRPGSTDPVRLVVGDRVGLPDESASDPAGLDQPSPERVVAAVLAGALDGVHTWVSAASAVAVERAPSDSEATRSSDLPIRDRDGDGGARVIGAGDLNVTVPAAAADLPDTPLTASWVAQSLTGGLTGEPLARVRDWLATPVDDGYQPRSQRELDAIVARLRDEAQSMVFGLPHGSPIVPGTLPLTAPASPVFSPSPRPDMPFAPTTVVPLASPTVPPAELTPPRPLVLPDAPTLPSSPMPAEDPVAAPPTPPERPGPPPPPGPGQRPDTAPSQPGQPEPEADVPVPVEIPVPGGERVPGGPAVPEELPIPGSERPEEIPLPEGPHGPDGKPARLEVPIPGADAGPEVGMSGEENPYEVPIPGGPRVPGGPAVPDEVLLPGRSTGRGRQPMHEDRWAEGTRPEDPSQSDPLPGNVGSDEQAAARDDTEHPATDQPDVERRDVQRPDGQRPDGQRPVPEPTPDDWAMVYRLAGARAHGGPVSPDATFAALLEEAMRLGRPIIVDREMRTVTVIAEGAREALRFRPAATDPNLRTDRLPSAAEAIRIGGKRLPVSDVLVSHDMPYDQEVVDESGQTRFDVAVARAMHFELGAAASPILGPVDLAHAGHRAELGYLLDLRARLPEAPAWPELDWQVGNLLDAMHLRPLEPGSARRTDQLGLSEDQRTYVDTLRRLDAAWRGQIPDSEWTVAGGAVDAGLDRLTGMGVHASWISPTAIQVDVAGSPRRVVDLTEMMAELARSGLVGPALRSGALAMLGRHLAADLRQAEHVAEAYGTTPEAIGMALADFFAVTRHSRSELPGGQPASEHAARQELQRLLDGLLSHQERARTAVEQRRHEGGAGPAGRDLDDVIDVLTALDVLSQRLAENLDRIQDLERSRVDAVTAGTTAYEQSLRPDAPADRSELFDAGRRHYERADAYRDEADALHAELADAVQDLARARDDLAAPLHRAVEPVDLNFLGTTLPLVHAVLDPSAARVTAEHLTRLEDLADIAQRRFGVGEVDAAALRREADFADLALTDDQVRQLDEKFHIGHRHERWDTVLDAVRLQRGLASLAELAPGQPSERDQLVGLRDAARLARSLGELPGAITVDSLLGLIRRTVDPSATAVTRAHVADLLGGIREARASRLRLPGRLTVGQVESHFIRAARQDGRGDSPRERQAEAAELTAFAPAADPAAVAALVRIRREALDPRVRAFAELDDYRGLTSSLLGVMSVDGAAIAELVALASSLPDPSQAGLAELAAAAAAAWPAGPPELPARSAEVAAHTAAMPRNTYLTSFAGDGLGQLTNFLNSLAPGGHGRLTQDQVLRKLRTGLNSAIDRGEGVAFRFGRGAHAVEVVVYFDVVRPPAIDPSVTIKGKSEVRVNRFGGRVLSEREEVVWGAYAGPYARTPGNVLSKIIRIGGYAQAGGGSGKGEVRRFATTTGDYTYFKLDDNLGGLDMTVHGYALRHQSETGRGQVIALTGADGAPIALTAKMVAPVSLLPDGSAPPEPSRPVTNRTLPLYRLHQAAEGVSFAGALRGEVRRLLGEEEYTFWAVDIERFLSNLSLAGMVGDVHRAGSADRDQASVPRLVLAREDAYGRARWLSLSLSAQARSLQRFGKPAKKMFDRVVQTSSDTRNSLSGTTQRRLVGSRALRVLDGFRSKMRQRSLRWNSTVEHQSRSWDTKVMAYRAFDPSQVVRLSSDYTVTVDRGAYLEGTAATSKGTVRGEAYVRMLDRDVKALENGRPGPVSTVDGLSYWTPMWPSTDFGFGHGYVFENTFRGLDLIYDALVPELVERGLLPPEARFEGERPWHTLQNFSPTLMELMRPGRTFANWRLLVDTIASHNVAAQHDSLMEGTAELPGVRVVLDAGGGERAVVGLSARINGPATYLRTDKDSTPLTTATGVRELTTRRVVGTGTERRATEGVSGGGDVAPGSVLPAGYTNTKIATVTTAQTTGVNSSATVIDYVRTEGATSVYNVPLTMTGVLLDGSGRVAFVHRAAGSVEFAQSDSLSRAGANAAPPPEWHEDLSPQTSPLNGLAVRGPIHVGGLAELQAALMATVAERVGDALDTKLITLEAVNKHTLLANRQRAMAAGGVPIWLPGVGPATWTALPVGEAQVMGRLMDVDKFGNLAEITAYTEGPLESQYGQTGGASELETTSDRDVVGYRGGQPTDSVGVAIQRGEGAGTSTQTTDTAGAYRTPVGTEPMYVVATWLRHEVTLDDGSVQAPGLAYVLVHKSEVLRQHDGFDDPLGIVEADIKATAPKPEDGATKPEDRPAKPAPVRHVGPAVLAGHLGATVTEHPVGPSPLIDKISELATRVGGPELRARVLAAVTTPEARNTTLADGGQVYLVPHTNGQTYEVLLESKIVGEPEFLEINQKQGARVYTRSNTTEIATESLVTQRGGGIDVALPKLDLPTWITKLLPWGKGGGDQEDGLFSLSANGVLTRVETMDNTTNALVLEGIRPKGLATFRASVETRVTLRRVHANRIGAALNPSEDAVVVREPRLLKIPVDNTLAADQPAAPPIVDRLNNHIPVADGAITYAYGMPGLVEAARELGARSLPLGSLAGDQVLTPQRVNAGLRNFLRPGGAPITGISSGLGQFGLPDGTTIEVTLGGLIQASFIRSAEFEHYDHNTTAGGPMVTETRRDGVAANLTLRAPIPGAKVGVRLQATIDHAHTAGDASSASVEGRSWLRDQAGSLIYLYVDIDIAMRNARGTRHVPGRVEFTVTEAGAKEMGISPAALEQIKGGSLDSAQIIMRDAPELPEAPVDRTIATVKLAESALADAVPPVDQARRDAAAAISAAANDAVGRRVREALDEYVAAWERLRRPWMPTAAQRADPAQLTAEAAEAFVDAVKDIALAHERLKAAIAKAQPAS